MTDPTAGGADDAGGDGGQGSDFLGSLPAEIRGEGALKNFGGADGGAKLASSFLSLNRSFSSRSMADMDAPGDDAGRRAVLSKLGHAAPDSPDGYTLPSRCQLLPRHPGQRPFRDVMFLLAFGAPHCREVYAFRGSGPFPSLRA